MADNDKRIMFTVEVIDKGKIKIDGIKSSFSELEKRVNSATNATKQFNKDGLNPMIDKTGLAGATLVEFGRTLSDLPYGFRGIANNLSQLSTLFTTLIATTGGLNEAIDSLKKAFRGPLGYIVLFQAVIALLDYFVGGTKKAKEETDKFNDTLQIQIDKFNTLAKIEYEISEQRNKRGTRDRSRIQKTGANLREQVKLLSAEFKQFDKMFKSLSDLSDESVNGLVDDFSRLLELKKAQKSVEQKLLEGEGNRAILERNLNKLILERIAIEDKYKDQSIENFTVNLGLKEEEIEANLNLKESTLELKDAKEIAFDAEMEKDQFLTQFNRLNSLERIDIMEAESLAQLNEYYKDIDNTLFYQQEKDRIESYYSSVREERMMSELEALAILTNGMADLLGEQSVMGKAFAVANATINTYLGASQALKDETIPSALKPIVVAGIIASGLGLVREILKVDETGGGKLRTGGGGAAETPAFVAPDFNIVGTSETSQLAGTIAGAEAKATRAYVVFDDIKDASDFDNKTQNATSFG